MPGDFRTGPRQIEDPEKMFAARREFLLQAIRTIAQSVDLKRVIYMDEVTLVDAIMTKARNKDGSIGKKTLGKIINDYFDPLIDGASNVTVVDGLMNLKNHILSAAQSFKI